MSIKSTSAPQYSAQLAEATKVIGVVQTISPLLTPNAKQAMCKADVAEFTATAKSALTAFLTESSNKGVCGPCVKKSDFKTLMTESISFLSISCLP